MDANQKSGLEDLTNEIALENGLEQGKGAELYNFLKACIDQFLTFEENSRSENIEKHSD